MCAFETRPHAGWRVRSSFGGAQAAQFCSQDTRCKAGIDIDGRPFGSVIANTGAFHVSAVGSRHAKGCREQRILSQIQAIYERQPHDSRLRIAIRGSHHFTFSDDGALLKSGVFRGGLRLFGVLGINGRRQVEITAYRCARSSTCISRGRRIAEACWQRCLKFRLLNV